MRDCIIISRSEDGTDYTQLSGRGLQGNTIISFVDARRLATRLDYHTATRIMRKLRKEQRRNRYGMARYYSVRRWRPL